MRKHSEKPPALPKVTISHWTWSRSADSSVSLHHPTQPPQNKGQHHEATLQVTDLRVTKGKKGQERACKHAVLGGKQKKGKQPTASLHKASFNLNRGFVASVPGHFSPGGCKHIFHTEDVEVGTCPRPGERGSRGTYRPRTLSGSSPRSRSGSPPHW